MAGELQMDGGEMLMATDGRVRFDNCACCVSNGIPDSPYLPFDSPYAIPSTATDLTATLAGYPLSMFYPPRLHRMCLRALIYCPLETVSGAYASVPTPRIWRVSDCVAGTGSATDIWWKPKPVPPVACVAPPEVTGKPIEYPECDCSEAGYMGGALFGPGAYTLDAELEVGDVDAVPTLADLNHLRTVLPWCYPLGSDFCCTVPPDGTQHVLQLVMCFVRWTIRDRATKTIQAGGLSHAVVVAFSWIRGRCDTLGCT